MACDLRDRIWTVIFALMVWRLGLCIPLPGLDALALSQSPTFDDHTIFTYLNLLTGGGFGNLSIFTLGLAPYFASFVVVLLLAQIWTPFHRLWKGGSSGRSSLHQYIRLFTLFLAIIQSCGLAIGLEGLSEGIVPEPGIGFRLVTVCTLTAGAMLLMWLGEKITRQGLGNGPLLIVACGIAAHLPVGVLSQFALWREDGMLALNTLLYLVAIVAIVTATTAFSRAQRGIIAVYARPVAGRSVAARKGKESKIPLKLAAVYPPVCTAALVFCLIVAMGISQWAPTGSFADVPMIVSWGFYLLVFPCIAYVTMIALADVECIAENLEAAGRAVPGYRPGRNTAAYLNHVVRRLAFAAVVFLTILCLLPDLMLAAFDAPLYFGSTGLLILILVIIMLVQSIHAATRPGGGPSNVFDGAMAKQPGLTDWQEHEDGLGDLFPDRPGKQDVASGN